MYPFNRDRTDWTSCCQFLPDHVSLLGRALQVSVWPCLRELSRAARPHQLDSPVPAAGALDLAVQIAGCLLSAGMSANDVVVVALRITRTYGLRRVHFDVTYTSIAASY